MKIICLLLTLEAAFSSNYDLINLILKCSDAIFRRDEEKLFL